MNRISVTSISVLQLIFLSLFVYQNKVTAQQRSLLYTPPGYTKVTVQKNVDYQNKGGRSLKFDFYRLPVAEKPGLLPVVIFMNGIGSADLKENPIQVEWAKVCAASGFAAVTFQSHFDDQPGNPSLLQNVSEDFDLLIDYLRANQKKFLLDPDTVVVHASSGNASLGLPILMDKKRSFIKAAVIYYGSSADVKEFRLDLPVFFVRAGLDQPNLNRQIDAFLGRALASNAPFEIVNHPGGQHPFEIGEYNEVSSEIIRRTVEFMRRAVSAKVQKSILATTDEATAAAALLAENWSVAASGYATLVNRRPQDSEMHRRYADALSGAKQYDQAVEEYEKALALGNWRKRDIAYAAAVAGAKLRDVKETLKWLNRLADTPFDRSKLLTDPNFEFLRGNLEFRALADNQDRRGSGVRKND